MRRGNETVVLNWEPTPGFEPGTSSLPSKRSDPTGFLFPVFIVAIKPSATFGLTLRWWAAIRKAPLGPLSDLGLMYNQIEDE